MTTDILCGQTKHHEQRAIRNELNLVFVQITFRRAPVTDFDRAGRASLPPSASRHYSHAAVSATATRQPCKINLTPKLYKIKLLHCTYILKMIICDITTRL